MLKSGMITHFERWRIFNQVGNWIMQLLNYATTKLYNQKITQQPLEHNNP